MIENEPLKHLIFALLFLGWVSFGVSPAPAKTESTASGTPKPSLPGPNLIVNGSFEQSPDPQGSWQHYDAGSTAIAGWRVSFGEIDLYKGITTPFGQKTIDLDGQAAGGVSQVIKTEPGCKYKLKFYIGSYDSDDKKVFVRAAGSKTTWPFSVPGGSCESPGLHELYCTFRARDTTTTIEIGSGQPGTQGPVLDNVSCVKIEEAPPPSAVVPPQPATTAAPTSPAPTPTPTPNKEEEEEEDDEPTAPGATPAPSK